MDSLIPKCIKGNQSFSICKTQNCNQIPFMCRVQDCLCEQLHLKCTSIKWKYVKQCLNNKLSKEGKPETQYFKTISNLYCQTIKQLEIAHQNFKLRSQSLGLSDLEYEFYNKVKARKFDEMTGSYIFELEKDLVRQTLNNQNYLSERQQKIKQKMLALIQVLQQPPIQTSFGGFQSKITSDYSTLSSFFAPKKITRLELLYRASENNFSLEPFHNKCDKIPHTLTLLKTQFGKILGGYNPFVWDKSKTNEYSTDANKQSFIFSVTNKEKLSLHNTSYAIHNYTGHGPAFGGGHDLSIVDQANTTQNVYGRIVTRLIRRKSRIKITKNHGLDFTEAQTAVNLKSANGKFIKFISHDKKQYLLLNKFTNKSYPLNELLFLDSDCVC